MATTEQAPPDITPLVPPSTRARASGRPPHTTRISTFDALKDFSFRWFFISMLGHMASMNMQMVVRSYLVFIITGSYAALGTTALANALPGLALAMVGGAIADRVPQKKYVVQAGQAVNGFNALFVAILLATGSLTFTALLVASVIQGTVNALMMPARQSLIPEIVGTGDRLMNAIALNASGMNAMRLFAPALGGYLIASLGGAPVYFLMMGLYFFACVGLFRVPKTTSTTPRQSAGGARAEARSALRDIREGVGYIAHHPVLAILLSVNLLLVVTAMPYMFMLAGFVVGTLHEGPDKIGLLQSVSGVGSLIGSLLIASVAWRRRGRLFLIASMLQGVALFAAFTLSTSFWMMAPMMLVMGIGQSGRQSFSNVLVQTYVEDQFRGRVMSIYMLEFSLSSFGTFFAGILAAMVGVRVALGATSAALVIVALCALLFVPRIRNLD